MLNITKRKTSIAIIEKVFKRKFLEVKYFLSSVCLKLIIKQTKANTSPTKKPKNIDRV
jgi:hypothetical protein